LLAFTVLLAGCKFKRVEDDRSVSVAAGAGKTMGVGDPMWELPAQPKDMDVTVTAKTAPASPVTLYLVLADDSEDVETTLKFGGALNASKVIAQSDKGETPTLQGTAPANKDCRIIVANAGGQPTEVKAKIIGKY